MHTYPLKSETIIYNLIIKNDIEKTGFQLGISEFVVF